MKIHGKTRTYVKPYVFKLILWKLYYFSLRVFTGTRMSTRSLLNLDPDPQVTRVTGHSELTDLKLTDLPTSKLIGSRELLGVVASPSRGAVLLLLFLFLLCYSTSQLLGL